MTDIRPLQTITMSVPPPSEDLASLVGTLTVLRGAALGTILQLEESEVVIGRSTDAGLQLDDEGISRCHARIMRMHDKYVLEDLGSTNGTFVDGFRLAGPCELTNGARIQMGATLAQFRLQDRIENEAARRVYEMAVRDGLTGLYNRRHFDERLSSEFAFAIRHRQPLGVIVADVDHFKAINDRYGHAAGDAVLKQIGRTLQASVRTEDVVARYGGEEFVVLVRGIDAVGTKALAERLRVILYRCVTRHDDEILRVTASFGVAHNKFQVRRPEQLVAAADAVLYEAKRRGRNCVVGPSAIAIDEKVLSASARHQTTEPKNWVL